MVVPNLELSTPSELCLPLHWIALLSGCVAADLVLIGIRPRAPSQLVREFACVADRYCSFAWPHDLIGLACG